MNKSNIFSLNKSCPAPHSKGFTIVELLIVIVVIGILATITIVAYNGVQQKAHVATLQSDLTSASKNLDIANISNSAYPIALDCTATPAVNTTCLKASNGTTYKYTVGTTPAVYCLTATNSSISYHIATNGTSTEGPCNGHTGTPPSDLSCPTGYITVPGNSLFGTKSFCVMKYIASNVGGVATSAAGNLPWVNISQTTSISTAIAGCSGCHLITEPEWLTIAQNVLSVPSNWSSGTVGNGYIYSGHNDNVPSNALAASSDDSDGYNGTGNTSPSNQRRTLTLTNGEVIWDLAGNVWEWTASTSTTGQPGSSGYSWRQWNALTTPGSLSANPMPAYGTPAASSWTSGNGIGYIYSNSDETALRGFLRSGSWLYGGYTGVLTLYLGVAPSGGGSAFGFRVAR